MKKQKAILLAVILLLCFIVISVMINQKRNIKKEQITIKEMSETTQVSDLQEQINQLNASHTEYANYVQSYKQAIATAITNQGVNTSADSTAETMTKNIGEILQERTKDATATEDNITAGKTAYVNGELITGTCVDNNSYYNQGYAEGKGATPYTSQWLRLCCWPHSSGAIPTWFDVSATDYNTLTLEITHHEQFHLYFDGTEQSSSSGTVNYDISNVDVIRFYVGNSQGYTNIKYTLN